MNQLSLPEEVINDVAYLTADYTFARYPDVAEHIPYELICPNGGLAKKDTNGAILNFCLISGVVYFLIHSNWPKKLDGACKLS